MVGGWRGKHVWIGGEAHKRRMRGGVREGRIGNREVWRRTALDTITVLVLL